MKKNVSVPKSGDKKFLMGKYYENEPPVCPKGPDALLIGTSLICSRKRPVSRDPEQHPILLELPLSRQLKADLRDLSHKGHDALGGPAPLLPIPSLLRDGNRAFLGADPES